MCSSSAPDGRLLSLQLDELVAGVHADRELVIRDYLPSGKKVRSADETLAELEGLGRPRTCSSRAPSPAR